jgi:hypothetical protein
VEPNHTNREKAWASVNLQSSFPTVMQISGRIYRPSFGHENDRIRENMPKTLVFNPILTQRRYFQLVLDKIRFWVVFKY